jgi:hypothetical protein
MNRRPRCSSAYISIMNVTATAPKTVSTLQVLQAHLLCCWHREDVIGRLPLLALALVVTRKLWVRPTAPLASNHDRSTHLQHRALATYPDQPRPVQIRMEAAEHQRHLDEAAKAAQATNS